MSINAFKYLSLLFIFISSVVNSQEINGFVISKTTNQPLENVSVYIQRINIGTATDEKGSFSFDPNNKTFKRDLITFSLLGYEETTITISKLIENPVIKLLDKIESLNKVTIVNKKKEHELIPFTQLTSLKSGIHSFDSELVDDTIYVIGGDASLIEQTEKRALANSEDLGAFFKNMRTNFSWENFKGTLNSYDLKSDTWTTLSDKLSERAYHASNYYNNTIYVLGGKNLSANRKREYLDATVELYDIKKDTLIIDNTNPHQAVNAASFIFEDNIIVMGGSTKLKKDGRKTYTNASHLYNITSGYWYTLPNMPIEKEVNGVLLDNTIYLIGGFNGRKLSSIESYNITTAKWKRLGSLFEGLNHPAITSFEDTIFIFENEKLIVMDIKLGSLIEYAINLKLKSSNIHHYQNKLYIIGGYKEDDFSTTPSKHVYSIDLSQIPKTKISRFKYLDSALPN